ncbi:hypothetical protein [Scatolibacter rhodanostii]|uniref:hypothetical protein n=1 Tax=Scatolibacter rhodanostii TaxID=2014781 RepID=UPI000C08180B|nr:hypothetical protein [Scatolibacter rhodanostii]
MSPYQEMYQELFQEVTQAIEILKSAQQKTEDIYIRKKNAKSPVTPMPHFNPDNPFLKRRKT